MKKKIILACIALALTTSLTCLADNKTDKSNSPKTHKLISPRSGGSNTWIAEDFSGNMVAVARRDTMEITNPKGLTLWYDKKLTGNYEITYSVKMIMKGGKYDRLSDLNCFWAAVDPKHPNNIYERAAWRNGSFENYNTLSLFYVGYGGNHNSTTRFREYNGELYGASRDEIKPVVKEYNDKDNLLKPNKWITIKITVKDEQTTYSVDGKALFTYKIRKDQRDGYFALRLLTNHTLITNFDIKQLK